MGKRCDPRALQERLVVPNAWPAITGRRANGGGAIPRAAVRGLLPSFFFPFAFFILSKEITEGENKGGCDLVGDRGEATTRPRTGAMQGDSVRPPCCVLSFSVFFFSFFSLFSFFFFFFSCQQPQGRGSDSGGSHSRKNACVG